MQTEADIQQCVRMMIAFMGQTAFSLLDKFEDLREIDAIINGHEPWESDWMKPYVTGGNFHLKRLVISKLSGSNQYDRLLDFIRSDFTSHFNDAQGADYKQSLEHVEQLNIVLRDVKPLY